MQCTYEPDGGCSNEAAPGSAFCAEHPLDDMMFYLRAMVEETPCPRCKAIVHEGFMHHECKPS